MKADVLKLHEFRLSQVKLTDPYYLNALTKDIDYLMSLEPDRLIAGFFETAGLSAKAQKYGGWEDSEIRGHTLGHYLTALAQAYASTGDKAILQRLEYVIVELKNCQDANGNGYLSAFPEEFIDRVENGKAVWVPWYTLHKILAGLIDTYQFTNIHVALDMAKKFGDWVDWRTGRLYEDEMQQVLNVEFGGMNEALYNLAQITRETKYATVAHRFDQKSLYNELLANNDILAGKHANTQIPKIVGAIRRYEVTGDPAAKTIAENFWNIVTNTRTYVTGGNSHNEHFGPANNLARELSEVNNETCNVYNMLKLTRSLFAITGDIQYADFYEKAYLNAILASQNPETGMTMYFQPMKPGYFKVFGSPFDCFWCCTGTGMENFTKLNDSLYFHNGSDIYVNLYVSSILEWQEKGIRLTQTTDIPVHDTAAFTINLEKPLQFSINLRVPDWLHGQPQVKVNGVVADIQSVKGYLSINRVWQNDDTIEVTLPMGIALSCLPDDPDTVAFKYGPVVLCAPLGGRNMNTSYVGVAVKIPVPDPETQGYIFIDSSTDSWKGNIADYLIRDNSDELAFTLKLPQSEMTFVTYNKQYKERFGIYWKLVDIHGDLMKKLEAERLEMEHRKTLIVDEVLIGNDQYESAHNVQSHNSNAGTVFGVNFRHAFPDGYFSYDMKVLQDHKIDLVCKYWGSDDGRVFDILIDGVLLSTVTLNNSHPNEFFEEKYPLPKELIQDKAKVTVKFVPHAGSFAGGLFGCCILRVDE